MKKRSAYAIITFLLVSTSCGMAVAVSGLPLPATAPPAMDPSPATNMAATDPVLFFSDITSGPKTGNSDTSSGRTGQDGAIVTLWGRNLGNAQGSSQVYVNGAEAASYYTWGNATAPADLYTYHQMQMVSFQISHLAQDGAGQIYVVVNGKQSNSLPFTVRSGNIYFSMATGHDDTGDGTWGNPWRTIPFAANSLAPGDIAYIGNGVDQTTETEYSAAVNLGSDGAEGNPKALIVYPGATSNVGNATLERAFWVWNGDTGGYSTHWAIAKFTITTGQVGAPAQTGSRVIGNYVTAPQGDGMDGAIDIVGNNVYILGNELENVGSANSSKLYHAIYVKGVRQDISPRAPTESNREVAWNYVHDGLSNRAINIYSEQEYSAYIQQHRIHDNVIVNQRGDGILVGYYVTGENWVWNNLLIRTGLGPEFADATYHTGLHIDTGHEAVPSTQLHVYNNTLYGNGWSGAVLPGETGSVLVDQGALDRSTTVYFSNNIINSTGEPYMAGESAVLPSGDCRNCWYGDGAAPGWDTTAINDNPDFVNVGAFDFQLQIGSPCVDVGKNVSTVVARDILGVPRPQGLAYDIGAYEYSIIPINVVGISANLTSSPAAGDNVTITLTVRDQLPSSDGFYKWWLASGYQTPSYGNWQMLQDWTANASSFTATLPNIDDHYVIVAWIGETANTTNFHQAGLTVETTGNSANPIQITALSTDMNYPQPSGTPINLSTTATGGSGQLYYRYFARHENDPWEQSIIREWNSSSNATWTPTQDGVYTIIVWVSDDTTVTEPPLAGMLVTIEQ